MKTIAESIKETKRNILEYIKVLSLIINIL